MKISNYMKYFPSAKRAMVRLLKLTSDEAPDVVAGAGVVVTFAGVVVFAAFVVVTVAGVVVFEGAAET